MKKVILVVFLGLLSTQAFASEASSYRGQEERKIKALSQADIDGYLNGKGMGYAKAAELNHYPGPKHVLELSNQLNLSSGQKNSTQNLFNKMKQDAIRIGKAIVETEGKLNELFASNTIDDKQLDSVLSDIGNLKAQLRRVHLSSHLKQKEILSNHQVKMYDQLRGYGAGHNMQNSHKHSH